MSRTLATWQEASNTAPGRAFQERNPRAGAFGPGDAAPVAPPRLPGVPIHMRPSLLLALLFGCSPTVTHDSSAVADDVQAVRVEVGAGHISVVGGDRLAVERTLSGVAVEGATQAIEDGVLRVAVACDTVLPCSADITLTVPAGVPVDVQVRDGGV